MGTGDVVMGGLGVGTEAGNAVSSACACAMEGSGDLCVCAVSS
jgi:hypothetical protein